MFLMFLPIILGLLAFFIVCLIHINEDIVIALIKGLISYIVVFAIGILALFLYLLSQTDKLLIIEF